MRTLEIMQYYHLFPGGGTENDENGNYVFYNQNSQLHSKEITNDRSFSSFHINPWHRFLGGLWVQCLLFAKSAANGNISWWGIWMRNFHLQELWPDT